MMRVPFSMKMGKEKSMKETLSRVMAIREAKISNSLRCSIPIAPFKVPFG